MAVRLPTPLLFELLDVALEPWGSTDWYPSRPPTDASVRRVQDELGVRLPPLLVEAASACPSYGGWFGSIGDDFDSHNHTLAINRLFRSEGLPPRYVMFNRGHDGDVDAWDTAVSPTTGGELPIVYFSFDGERPPPTVRALTPTFALFAEYIDDFVRTHAVSSPRKGPRRRAKRLIAQHDAAAVDSPP